MNKPDKSSIFKTSLFVALLGTVFGTQAAGLGKLTVYSAIGQPLNAEVALSATTDELGGLSARLAPHEAFKDAGIEFMPALTGLRMSIGKSSVGQPVLRLSTDAPLNEPFLHFLVELNWTAGRMVREYTFLLDPPEMLQVAKPVSVVVPAAPVARTIETAMISPRTVAPARESGEVRVKAGDTLSKIARENKPETVSLDQMLVALFNGNRDAFIGDNMNRLQAGKILKLPDEGTVAQVDQGEARRMIVSQAADFNAYRRRLAEAATAVPTPTAEPQQSASGRIKPQIEQKAAAAPLADKLEVSRTESARPSGGVDKGRLEEELIARDKALREASERIAQLEKNLDSLKRLAELKSQAGVQVQQQAQAVAPAPAELAAKKPEAPAPVPAPAQMAEPATAPVTTPPPVAPAPKPVPKATPKPASPPSPPEADFVAENPELVFGGGGLIALLLGYLGYNAWRRKKQSGVEEVSVAEAPSFLSETELPKAFEAGSVAASSGLADDVSILGDFSQGGLTTEESADPVAEADVLMAYGRDGQAEEILREGLKSDPVRGAIHLKLMELYANRKDVAKFEAVAQDLHALNHGQGPEWKQASVLARDLGVTGTLFPADVAEASEPAPAVEAVAEDVTEDVTDEVATEPVAAEQAISAVLPGEESDSLDFDLDLGTTSMPAAIAVTEAAQAKPTEEAMSLDFDFDLGTPSIPEPPPPAAEAEQGGLLAADDNQADAAVAVDDSVIDFSLDMDADFGQPEVVAEAPPVIEMPADDSGSHEVDFNLDLDLDAAVPGEATAVEPDAVEAADLELAVVPVLESAERDAEALDFDLGTDESEVVAEAEMAPETEAVPVAVESMIGDLGLSDISLDLEPLAVELPEVTKVSGTADTDLALPDIEAPAAEESNIDLEASSLPAASMNVEADDPEVATKLELAQAYEEMGDREGARELLNEVLSEGSPAQQALARTRLDQLDV